MVENINARGKTVGYILDFIHSYQETVWIEVNRNLQASGASLVAFVGQSLLKGSYGEETATNQVFDLAFCDWIDSFLLSGATLGSYIDKAEYEKCLGAFRKKRCVSIGACPTDIPMIVIENRSGIRNLVAHLATAHGKKRIAYLSGPKSSAEADERLAAYREGLEAASLPYDPSLVFIGNFWYSGGKEGIDELLDVRGMKPDAVVAANDYMALGALRELSRRGYRIPQDIAVTGYDDVVEAECESPALTTVRQPVPEQAAASVRYLLGGLSAAPEPLETQIVVRRSCGCQSQDIELASRAFGGGSAPSESEIAADIAKVVAFKGTEPGTIRGLIAKCLKDAEECNFDRFYQDAESAIFRGVEAGDETDSWQNAVSVIRSGVWPRVKGSEGLFALENAVGKLRILVGSLETNKLILARSKDAEYNENLGLILKAVSKAEDMRSLGATLRERAGDIGLKSLYFAVKAEVSPECGDGFDPNADFILHCAVSDGKDLLGADGPRRYRAGSFLPEDLLPKRPFSFIAMPVTFGGNFYGVAVFEPGPLDGTVYSRVNDQLGAALRSVLVIGSWKEAEKSRAEKSAKIVSLARPISESVLAAAASAREEASTVESVGEAARKAKEDIAQTESAITRMAEKARSIKEYIALIEDISSTISLLGLNAAIEAARAGQAGRGFNVIAGEIRKLSDSTKANVERIGAVLSEFATEADRSEASAKRSSVAFTALDAELATVLSVLKQISGRLDSLSASSEELIAST